LMVVPMPYSFDDQHPTNDPELASDPEPVFRWAALDDLRGRQNDRGRDAHYCVPPA
jgi:hypothetical protein